MKLTENRFWKFINKEDEKRVELQIEGDIVDDNEAWLYEWFGVSATSKNAFKEELSNYSGQDIVVWIDSYGGDVFAAAGIYNSLKEHSGKVTVKIDGKAMSAASIVAMAGDEILMSPVGVMMIHNPLTYAQGDARVMRKTAEVLDVIKETIINAYMRSGKTSEELWEMMDDETWMSANVAVKEGFADEIMYQEEPIKAENIKGFSFNRLAVVNSANKAIRKMMELEKAENKSREGDDPVEINTVEELKNAYPELIREIIENAREEGAKNERKRIKKIEDISQSIDPKLLNKAKFEEPMDAKDLAFEALKIDGKKGEDYLNKVKEDNKVSGVNNVKANSTDTKEEKPKSVKDKAKSIAAKFDAKRRGVEVNG